jgi:type IV pilus assembly protein PilV
MNRKDSDMDKKGILSRFPLHKASGGFTLVEVLVSVIIFSVGLIGVARLQVVAKQNNYDAVQRVAATSVAQDMLSRMRSNHTVLNTYVSNSGSTTVGRNSISSEPTPVCGSSGTQCTASQLATHDLWEIEKALDGIAEQDSDGNSLGGLTLPTLCITGPASGDSGVYTVAIAWRGKAELSNPAISTCGDDTGLYGDANEFRRVLVMQTFITSI